MKKLERKNPLREIVRSNSEKLRNLENKEIIISSRSKLVYFSVEGLLVNFGTNYIVSEYINHKNGSTTARINFERKDIINIINNNIYILIFESRSLNILSISENFKFLFEKIGYMFKVEIEDLLDSVIIGKLKYNKSSKEFYILEKDHRIQLYFSPHAVKSFNYWANSVVISMKV